VRFYSFSEGNHWFIEGVALSKNVPNIYGLTAHLSRRHCFIDFAFPSVISRRSRRPLPRLGFLRGARITASRQKRNRAQRRLHPAPAESLHQSALTIGRVLPRQPPLNHCDNVSVPRRWMMGGQFSPRSTFSRHKLLMAGPGSSEPMCRSQPRTTSNRVLDLCQSRDGGVVPISTRPRPSWTSTVDLLRDTRKGGTAAKADLRGGGYRGPVMHNGLIR
jgi:hypothetical protein